RSRRRERQANREPDGGAPRRAATTWSRMDDWIETHAQASAARAPRELGALVAVSSPSGDVHGAEEAAAVAAALAPGEAGVERGPCSSHAPSTALLVRLPGTGAKRVLLLGHVDTVVSHVDHRPLRREEARLVGS